MSRRTRTSASTRNEGMGVSRSASSLAGRSDGASVSARRPRGLAGWLTGLVGCVMTVWLLVPGEATEEGGTLPGATLALVAAAGLWVVLAIWPAWRVDISNSADRVASATKRRPRGPGLWIDGLLILATVGVLASMAVVAFAGTGEGRVALNVGFTWAGMVALYLIQRQAGPAGADGTKRILVALAIGMATLAVYQFFVQGPAIAAEYFEASEARKTAMLAEAGLDAPPGSPSRSRFEDRLRSVEPLGRFSLTNSLAGFLLPWAVIGVGLAVRPLLRRRTVGPGGRTSDIGQVGAHSAPDQPTRDHQAWRDRTWGGWAVAGARLAAVALIGFVLVTTKSRTALIAAAVAAAVALGLVVWTWWRDRDAGGEAVDGTRGEASGRSPGRVGLIVGAVAVGGMILAGVAGVATGALDREVLTEARKSLGYRGEYWAASMAMIRDAPWLGVGPGNFQRRYAQYKPPQASETVRDPHQAVLELAATAGLPTAVAWVAFVVAVLLVRPSRLGDDSAAVPPALEPPSPGPDGTVPIIVALKVAAPDVPASHVAVPGGTVRGGAGPGGEGTASVRSATRWGLVGVATGFVVGVPLAFLAGHPPDGVTLGLLAVGALLGGVIVWPGWGGDCETETSLGGRSLATWDDAIVTAAVVGLVVNLMAAGGVSYPPIGASLLLLAAFRLAGPVGRAISPPASDVTLRSPAAPSVWARLPVMAMAVGLIVVLGANLTLGVGRGLPSGQAAMLRSDATRDLMIGRFGTALDRLDAAITADPWSGDGPLLRARLKAEQAIQTPSTVNRDAFLAAAEAALAADPYSPGVHEVLGVDALRLSLRTSATEPRDWATRWLTRAIQLSPSDARLKVQAAVAFELLGQAHAAASQAESAWAIDADFPHQEGRLDRTVVVNPSRDGGLENGHHAAERLRTMGGPSEE